MKRPMPPTILAAANAVLSRRPELRWIGAGAVVAQGVKEGA
jgi:hypothetical protein